MNGKVRTIKISIQKSKKKVRRLCPHHTRLRLLEHVSINFDDSKMSSAIKVRNSQASIIPEVRTILIVLRCNYPVVGQSRRGELARGVTLCLDCSTTRLVRRGDSKEFKYVTSLFPGPSGVPSKQVPARRTFCSCEGSTP